MIIDEKEFEQKCEEYAKEFAEAITPTEAEILEWFKPLRNCIYPPNCARFKRHSKQRARQYGRK